MSDTEQYVRRGKLFLKVSGACVFMTVAGMSGSATAEPRRPQSWSVTVMFHYPAEVFRVDFFLSSINAA